MVHDTEKFLALLAEGEPCTFQTFDDTELKRKQLNKVLHGDLDRHFNQLKSLNQRRAGVYVMVNAGDGMGRKTDNVLRVRAVFVDLDGSPIKPVMEAPLQPHIIVETSPKRFHAYWLVDDIHKQEFRSVQEMLARRFYGDISVKDLPRVMRLAGFFHQKHEPPYLTHILHINEQERFNRTDFFDAFGFDPSVTDWKDKQSIHEGQRNTKLFNMARGFVSKGFGYQSIFRRICQVNNDRCNPPLDENEVAQIVQQAMHYGASGELRMDYKLIDSPAYKALSPRAKVLDMAARRIANGNPQAVFTLLASDLAPWGFGNPKTLAKYRKEVLEHGFLDQVRIPRYGQNGDTRECGLYKLGEPNFYGKTYYKKT